MIAHIHATTGDNKRIIESCFVAQAEGTGNGAREVERVAFFQVLAKHYPVPCLFTLLIPFHE